MTLTTYQNQIKVDERLKWEVSNYKIIKGTYRRVALGPRNGQECIGKHPKVQEMGAKIDKLDDIKLKASVQKADKQ